MKIFTNLRNRFSKFVIVDRETSTITLSRALYKAILKTTKPIYEESGLRHWEIYNVCFWKVKNTNGALNYVFFVNPDWSKHEVANPNFVFQTPILLDPNDHPSIKSMMPTVNELLSVYGIPGSRVRLKVSLQHLNGEQYYSLERNGYKILEIQKSSDE